jgi:hypothetical protein
LLTFTEEDQLLTFTKYVRWLEDTVHQDPARLYNYYTKSLHFNYLTLLYHVDCV